MNTCDICFAVILVKNIRSNNIIVDTNNKKDKVLSIYLLKTNYGQCLAAAFFLWRIADMADPKTSK